MPQHSIQPRALKEWLEKGEAVLVDVREPAEHHSERIAEATLVPLAQVSRAALPDHARKKLVLHCRKGARGESACKKLLAEDPSLELYNLEGGINAWAEAGLPVASAGRMLPLDQQVQLTIGTCLVIGSVLGYFITPLFFLLTAFFGAGLIFAGVTGICGLARLIAIMPWNQRIRA